MSDATEVIRAERNGRYYLRFLLMGLGAFVFALFCVKDGLYSWPDKLARQEAFLRFQKEEEEQGVSKAEEWKAYAKEHDWSAAKPDMSHPMSQAKITGQFIMAAVCGVVALGFFTFALSSIGRWIEANETAITSSWGEEIPFNQVTGLDKRKWQNKGIAKVKYKNGGKTRMFVIDDFKFKRQPTDAILYRLEQNIDQTLITGGRPEKPPAPATEAIAKGEPVASSKLDG